MKINMLLNKILIRRYDDDDEVTLFYVLNPSNKTENKIYLK